MYMEIFAVGIQKVIIGAANTKAIQYKLAFHISYEDEYFNYIICICTS
jgi:hypothetical protein